jgi:hypothetical protein
MDISPVNPLFTKPAARLARLGEESVDVSPHASVTHGHPQTARASAAVPGGPATPPPGAGWGQPQLYGAPTGVHAGRATPRNPAPEDQPLFGGALGSPEPPMRMRHLIALCGWAAALTLLGLGVGFWAMIRLMAYGTPGWYEPVIVVTGLTGMVLAIAAFVTADKRYAPWALMGASTLALFLAIGITANV